MNNQEVKNYIDSLVLVNRKGSHKIEKTCQYKGSKDERFCKASCQSSCRGCSFYSPNYMERMRLIATLLKNNEDEKDTIRSYVEYYRTAGTGIACQGVDISEYVKPY